MDFPNFTFFRKILHFNQMCIRDRFSWQEGHLNSFVVVLVSHVVDNVQCIYISVSQPVKRFFEVSFDRFEIKDFVTNWFDVKYFVCLLYTSRCV